ncbi:MAG TPA: hypothetical protein DEO38_00045 [Bacteroidales bacterium]|nr:hypothetical protein [Bacteroidales bacterium]
MKKYLVLIFTLLLLCGCAVSFKFNGASIDYTKTRTISILEFPNHAELVNPNLSSSFSELLRDQFSRQTRLELVPRDGDLHIEGEITGYQVQSMAISADSYAAQTKLTLTIKVRFSNKSNPEDDFEKSYSAYQTFDSNQMLTDVQDELCQIMSKEIAENIYNDTVAKW